MLSFSECLVYACVLFIYTISINILCFIFFFFNWDSFHARLNSHFEAWSYKKRSTKRLQHAENYCMGFYYHLQMKKIKHLESFQQNNLWFWIIYYFLTMRIIVFFSVWHYEKNFVLVIYVNFTIPYIRSFREYTSWRHLKFWTPNSIAASMQGLTVSILTSMCTEER